MKIKYIILINIILISLWIVAKNVVPTTHNYDLNLTVAEDVPPEMIEEVKEAVEFFPNQIIKTFSENDWKIVLLRDFDDAEGYEYVAYDSSVVGLIHFSNKTITIRGVSEYSNTARDIMIHELCHFVDRLWDSESNSKELLALLEKYKDGQYRTFAYAGIELSDTYKADLLYATSNRQEFFAEAMKDYLLHPEYLKENYPDIHDYFRLLFIKKEW